MEGEEWIAHSAGIDGRAQTMRDHIRNVDFRAVKRCPDFLRDHVRLAVQVHDFGKYSDLFRLRLEGKASGLITGPPARTSF